jgi:hypothetical protein
LARSENGGWVSVNVEVLDSNANLVIEEDVCVRRRPIREVRGLPEADKRVVLIPMRRTFTNHATDFAVGESKTIAELESPHRRRRTTHDGCRESQGGKRRKNGCPNELLAWVWAITAHAYTFAPF